MKATTAADLSSHPQVSQALKEAGLDQHQVAHACAVAGINVARLWALIQKYGPIVMQILLDLFGQSAGAKPAGGH